MSAIIKLSDVKATGRYEPGMTHMFGLTTETCGAVGACLCRVSIPPGHQTRAHFHLNAETFNYILSGTARVIVGAPGLETTDEIVGPDTFVYWAKGEIHKLINVSESENLEMIGGYSCGSGEASGKIYIEPPIEGQDASL